MVDKDNSELQDSGNGYGFRSFKIEKFKPFNLEEALKDTWSMSVPDGKGYVTNYGGHFIDGKMVEEWRETVPDPLFNHNAKDDWSWSP